MKKTMLLLIAAIFSIAVFAQDRKQTEIKISQLPKETTKWVSENIAGGKIVRAGQMDEKGTRSYAAVVESNGQKYVYLFDKNGKFTGKGDPGKFKGQPAKTTKAVAPATPPSGTSTDTKK